MGAKRYLLCEGMVAWDYFKEFWGFAKPIPLKIRIAGDTTEEKL